MRRCLALLACVLALLCIPVLFVWASDRRVVVTLVACKGLDVGQLTELVRQRGLCVRVGGGQMWGWAALSSNDACLTIAITTGDELVLGRDK